MKRWGVSFVRAACVLLAALCLCLRAAGAQSGDRLTPGEVIVGLQAGGSAAQWGAIFTRDIGFVVGYQPRLQAVRVRLRPGVTVEGAIRRLAGRAGVLYVEPNFRLRAVATPNDPAYPNQYGLQTTQTHRSWNVWQPRAPVIFAVLDTGADYAHPDLSPVFLRNAAGVVVGHNTLTGADNAQDDQYHGTHVSGIVAARINNSLSVAGVAGWNPAVANSGDYVRLMPVKVLDRGGNGTDASVTDGILWAVDHGAKVINLSLGSTDFSQVMDQAIQYAWKKGCLIVAAAGNNGNATRFYPAASNNVISVAATDSADKLTYFSNYGDWVKVAAPGWNIVSTYPGSRTMALSGTSMASPYVAGEAAALLAQDPFYKPRVIYDLITGNVDPYTPYATGHTITTGGGRVNVYRALLAAGTGVPGVAGIALARYSLRGGTSTSGTVYLGSPARTDTTLTLSASHTAVQVPAAVTVAAGTNAAAFSVGTTPVAANTTVTLTASDGVTNAAITLTVTP